MGALSALPYALVSSIKPTAQLACLTMPPGPAKPPKSQEPWKPKSCLRRICLFNRLSWLQWRAPGPHLRPLASAREHFASSTAGGFLNGLHYLPRALACSLFLWAISEIGAAADVDVLHPHAASGA